ncbi:Hypothetical Protein FCC1311_072682 [Hondaea fermentalgiana]|uniref:Uncharacterized protein n=1 Tax=Hondaea fermentalgiana TaxID=2315210 RepID=A0A2R5GJI8_9STRA|nr:Hypothetical Protein FCC1311_072682 [Hondaea fermentalgiana]|eukprot:GBG31047.1 Hypothetical Protein FCC1311_072682 [Hondaea fermentalgiana]
MIAGNDTAPNTVMNHVLILEIPEESLATALHSNIPLELELLLARESVLGSKTLGEALRALHGTQIVAAHEHLYFAALDIVHEGERAPSDVDVCDADQEESQGTKAEAQIALCAVDEDKIETTLGPVVASTLVHAFVSQGVDRVCARFREHAMRNIWSEISQDATARLAASGEMVRDLQQVNSALRVQRDAAIDELRGMRDELERARENALEANRAAREKALAMEDLQMNLASLNTSMVETKQQEVEPEIVSDDDEDASEGREDNTITMRKNTRSDFKSPVTPHIALEDALAGLAAKARLKSPNSPFCVKQASLPSWAQDPQIVAPSLLDSPAAEVHCGAAETAYSDDETSGRPDAINTERVVADSGHSKKSNNDVEDHDSLMEERKTSEEELTPRTLGSKERLHAQLLAQSASNSEASDGGSLSVSVPQATASTYSSAVLAPGASRVGHPSPTLLMNERRPESSLPLSPTNQRSTKLQDDACLSPCSFEAEAMDRAHQEELARVQREHRMTLVTMDNNHRQQIKSLQGVMKKALLEAQLRREATEVSQTLQGEGSETESDLQSELETAAKRTAELENELEIAIKQTSELEDQLEACRSRLCEQRCTLDEKDTILQAKDQLLQAYASQIRMQRSVSSLPKQDLHIELLGKVASRALATACQQQCIVEALRTAHKTKEAEVMEASAMGSKNTVIAGLRCQIASQVAVIDSERRATQAALGQSDMALAEKRQAEAKLEEERKAHAATKSLLADAEACIRSQMEHMEHTAPRSILMGENASAGDKNDDGMVDNDADDDEEEEDEEDNFQYTVKFTSQLLIEKSLGIREPRAPPRHPEPRQYFETENSPLAADGVVSAGRRGELGISRSSSMSAITARVDSAGQLGSARSTSSSMILGPALEHIERLEEAFRTQRAQIRVYHGLVDKSKHGHAREVTSMRRVAAGLHASRVAIERSFASERRNLLVRVHHLERELQETKLALQGEIDCLQARADDLANKVLHADSEEVREVVQKMCTISERLRALRPVTSEMVSADAQERHAMQEQLQLLELTCERQRIKHAEALAEALAEAEHHKDCRENLRQKYNALQPQSAFEIFDSFHVPNDMESTKRARIERILEDLRVTLASLEPYLVRDERL